MTTTDPTPLDGPVDPPDGPADPSHIRGRGFLDSGLYDDAIAELTQALGRAPASVAVIRDLAKAHLLRWRRALDAGGSAAPHATGTAALPSSDSAESERLLRRALELSPDDREAHGLIAQLRRVQEQQRHQRTRRGGPSRLIALGALISLIAAFGLVLIVYRSAPNPSRPHPDPPGAAIADLGGPSGGSFEGPRGEELVLELLPGELHQGVTLSPTHVELKLYSTAWFEYRGLLHNGTRDVISELEARIELFEEDGTVILTDHKTLLGDHEAPLRPGDVLPLGGTERATPAARRLRFTLTASKRAPSDDVEVPLQWGMPTPAGASLQVTQRRHRQNPHMGASWFVRYDLQVLNTGTNPVESLKFEARFLDAEGKQIATDDSWIVGPDDPPLPPGVAYGGTVLEIVERQPASIELWVARYE